MPYKVRSNLGNKSWKILPGRVMQGFNKSWKHAALVSLDKLTFYYPKSPQILVVYSSESFSLMFLFLMSLLPLCSMSSSFLDQSWRTASLGCTRLVAEGDRNDGGIWALKTAAWRWHRSLPVIFHCLKHIPWPPHS